MFALKIQPSMRKNVLATGYNADVKTALHK
jgi:hypothetical protein